MVDLFSVTQKHRTKTERGTYRRQTVAQERLCSKKKELL